MAEQEDGTIPEGVYWNGKENMFFDAQNHTKGGKFFDKWKDRREEFPQHVREIMADGAEAPPAPSATPVRRRRVPTTTPVSVPDTAPATPVAEFADEAQQHDYAYTAQHRRRLYLAYVEAGFTRDEALELCIRD